MAILSRSTATSSDMPTSPGGDDDGESQRGAGGVDAVASQLDGVVPGILSAVSAEVEDDSESPQKMDRRSWEVCHQDGSVEVLRLVSDISIETRDKLFL